MGIWSIFAPDMSCHRVTDISLGELHDIGIKGLLLDLDNTITAWHKTEVTESMREWLRDLKDNGFAVCIVSNNRERRVKKIAEQLGLPYFFSAAKPRRKGYRRAAALLNIPLPQLAMVGDQLFTDVLGGNRAGLFTIFVEYIHPQEHWGTTHIFRPLERWVLKKLEVGR